MAKIRQARALRQDEPILPLHVCLVETMKEVRMWQDMLRLTKSDRKV